MSEQFKFQVGRVLVAPLMPIVFFQGKRIRKSFPTLPEAKKPQGVSGEQFTDELRVIGLGESTMAGVGIDTHSNALMGQFSKQLAEILQKRISWKVYAKSGLTAEQTRLQLLPKIDEKQVDLFIISLGGNDTFQLNSPNEWSKQITLLIKELRLQFPSTPILFTTMPPVHTFPAFTGSIQFVLGNLVKMHGRQLKKTIQSFDRVYFDSEIIDLKAWLKKLPEFDKEDFYSDGVHPSTLTFKIWGKELADLTRNKINI